AGFALWWNDCTASVMGEGGELTKVHAEARSVNEANAAALLPGDLAVTTNGVHVLAYVGDGRWIEADPGVGRVITLPVPEPRNAWFNTPVRIVRWRVLEGG